MDQFEKEDVTSNINVAFARAFINYLNAVVAVEMSEILMMIPSEGIRFKMLNTAHHSVLGSLALLVTSKDVAFKEYDGMLTMLEAKAPGSTGAHILKVGRENMEKMLHQASIIRGN